MPILKVDIWTTVGTTNATDNARFIFILRAVHVDDLLGDIILKYPRLIPKFWKMSVGEYH